jgi:hypothetical protein
MARFTPRLALALLAACDVTPLTHQQLFGTADAGAPDLSAGDSFDGSPGGEPACVPRSHDGLFSGGVVDACSGAFVIANVGIGGQHACTFAFKGSFQFRNLPVGCQLTVSATAPGYAARHAAVVIAPGGTAGYVIRLQRLDDPPCQGAAPSESQCICDIPGCITP